MEFPHVDDSVPAVLKDLEALKGAPCKSCRKPICGHEALMSRMLGLRSEPRCWPCLARLENRIPLELRDHLASHVKHRDCYAAGWQEANRLEGFAEDALPACLYAEGEKASPRIANEPPPASSPGRPARAEWDAGAMGCGDLVLELRIKLKSLHPGDVLEVRATDPGAPEDLPAWCRLTGNKLLAQSPPTYWIQRKEI